MLDKLSPRLKMHEQTWPRLCALLMCVFMCDRARESPSGGRELRQPATTSPLLSLQAHNNPLLLLQGFSLGNIARAEPPP